MVCLAFRPQSGLHHVLGRETSLAPVNWEKNAWPIVNGNGIISLNMEVPTLPLQPIKKSLSTNFEEDELGFEWNYLRNPNLNNYELNSKKGSLRLKATPILLDDVDSPTFLGRRQEHIQFTATTKMELFNAKNGDEAGLTVFRNNTAHYKILLKQDDTGKRILALSYRLGELSHTISEIKIPRGSVYLQVKGENDYYSFAFSTNGTDYKFIDKLDVRYLSSETNGGFTGAYIGLFATSKNKTTNAYADFDLFNYLPK